MGKTKTHRIQETHFSQEKKTYEVILTKSIFKTPENYFKKYKLNKGKVNV